ncbi:bifunctional glycosyltransferase/CDP-glycerol:glycerophosphate glycerophosphotransferase [Sporolactobacillus spathodeae]|nr:bifunctional glycosyltransferase/CDP-glycerol:glycerophosphate glycerophosphotransferase [Sporolactobacillus spathodeae]
MDYKISVIVPGYQVENYIRQCLDSIAGQSFNQIQVIMVDDGSQDGTGAIMDQYAENYDHFQVIHQENKGLGAARNVGVAYAEGEYLAFVDGDDYLSLDAYEVLYRMAQHTHSDIVVGGVNRFNSKKNIRSWLHKKAIYDTKEKTHITQTPSLLYDTTAWNKLYKRSFWEKHQFSFPEGMLYEDIPVTIPAHFLASSVDIVEKTIYYWRIRENDDQSITQRKNDIGNFMDRLKALEMVRAFMTKHPVPQEIRLANQFKYLIVDYYFYLKALPSADSVHINQLQQLLSKELKEFDPSVYTKLPARLNLAYQLVLQNKMEDVIRLMKMKRRRDLNFKPYQKDGHWYKKYSFSETMKHQPICVDQSLEAVSRVQTMGWADKDHFTITGHAYIEGIDSKSRSQVRMSAVLVNLENGKQLALPVTLTKDPSVTRKWGTIKTRRFNPLLRVYDYDWSQFTIKIAANDSLDQLNVGRWAIELMLIVQGVERTIRLGNPNDETMDAVFRVVGGKAWKIHNNGNYQLSLDVYEPDVLIHDGSVVNNQLVLIGRKNRQVEDICFSLFNTKTKKTTVFVPEIHTDAPDKQFELIIPNEKLGEMTFDQTGWMVGYHLSGQPIPYPVCNALTHPDSVHLLANRDILIETDEERVMIFASKWQHPTVQYLSLAEQTLTLELHLPETSFSDTLAIEKRWLIFESQNNAAPVTFDLPNRLPDAHTYTVHANLIEKNGSFKMFTTGAWNLYLEELHVDQTGRKQVIKRPVILSNVLREQAAICYTEGKLSFCSEIGSHFSLQFLTEIKWSFLDQSTRRRKFIKWYLYPLMRFLPIKKNVIVFESLWGRAFNDNPKAIFDSISQTYGKKYKYIWFLNNEYTPVTAPAQAVRKNSWRYFYYLARGKYFVENTNLPDFYVKRKGQIEMQTLHGTFMKTMGLDEKVTFNTRKKQNALLKRSGRWDYLISPSPYMSDIAAKAFMFQNKMVPCGFPRNDLLYQKNDPQSIAAIKKKLHLPADKKIILYAPTFRQRDQFDLKLDLEQLEKSLSSEYVLLLRLHYFIASKLERDAANEFVSDVSYYPDIQELFLVADVMITDYSSVMFDYAHLRRPMVFFAYDLDQYRNQLRGMYLDYEQTVPGPIVQTNEELIDALLNLPGSHDYQEKYEQFINKFCTFGRGDSAKTAAEQLLSPDIELQPGEPFLRNLIKKKTSFVYPALFRRLGRLPRKKIVLFESFFGKQYSDNPRAIYEYMKAHCPDYQLIWNVQKGYEAVFKKEKVPYVIKYSYRGLLKWAQAKYWVNNSRWPLWLPKPKDTVYLQTWHGTPLKRLGADIEHITMPGMTLQKYHSQFTSEARKWDYCLAPNAYSSEIFKRAFEVQGEMIPSGYPRNDLLYNKNNPEEISQLKSKLGIPNDKKVILYAPTWRDNEYKKIGHYTFELKLDLKRMQEKFGTETVLLVRLHYLIADQIDLSAFNDYVLNVSDYPDIRELYLVSDCLITDYSSVFFDFANLKRPIIFYTYDLDDYGNEIRGFYFDLEKEAPGPIVKDMDHLLPAVREALDYKGTNPYPDFYQRFCEWEDGSSSERVVKALLSGKITKRHEPMKKRTIEDSKQTDRQPV